MAVWKHIALSDDLPTTFDGSKEGLVPSVAVGARGYLDHTGNWTTPRSIDVRGDSRNFQGAIDESPPYSDAEIGRHLSFVKGLSIASISGDGTNVTIVTNLEHGLVQSDAPTVTISGCSNSAYNGTKTINGFPTTKSLTFAETNTTAVTINGYLTTSTNAKDDYMLHWSSDVGLADHSVAFSKLPELNAMKVIGNTTGGSADVTEVSIELTPTNASTNLITSGGVYAAVNSIQDSKISSASTWNGKQDALTFGIAQNNTVKVSSAVVDSSSGVIFPKFTSTGLTARSSADFKTDLSLVKADVGLGSVDNTTDANKPISTATQSALDAKQASLTFGIADTNAIKVNSADVADDEYARFTATGLEGRTTAELKTDLSLAKADVGLGNVDNTADASKPVSTATQSALDAKQATLTFGKSSGNSLKSEEALTTDDVLLMGTSNVKGRTIAEFKTDMSMHLLTDIKISGFYTSSSSKQFVPVNGTLTETTGTSYNNDSIVFVAPYDGQLEQVVVRTGGVPGSTVVGLHKSSTGTENPNATASSSVTVNMSVDDTAYKFSFNPSNNTFSAGDVLAVSFDPTTAPNSDVNLTMIFVYDTTQGV